MSACVAWRRQGLETAETFAALLGLAEFVLAQTAQREPYAQMGGFLRQTNHASSAAVFTNGGTGSVFLEDRLQQPGQSETEFFPIG